MTVYSANDRVVSHTLPDTGVNMLVYARSQDEQEVVRQAKQAGVNTLHETYQLPVHAYTASGQKIIHLDKLAGYTSEDVGATFSLSGDPWLNDDQVVYVPLPSGKRATGGTDNYTAVIFSNSASRSPGWVLHRHAG